MKEKDDNSKLTSANNTEGGNSESSDYQQNDRTDPIAHICSNSGYNNTETMGEVIKRWESNRYIL